MIGCCFLQSHQVLLFVFLLQENKQKSCLLKNLVIIQTVVPDYRKGFFNAIENALDQHFELYGGDFYFEKSVKNDCTIPKKKNKKLFYF